MNDQILAALIGGAFTLLAALLGVYLDRRRPIRVVLQPGAATVSEASDTRQRPAASADPAHSPLSGIYARNLIASGLLGTSPSVFYALFGAEAAQAVLFHSLTVDVLLVSLFLNPHRDYRLPVVAALFYFLALTGGVWVARSVPGWDESLQTLAFVFGAHIGISWSLIRCRRFLFPGAR